MAVVKIVKERGEADMGGSGRGNVRVVMSAAVADAANEDFTFSVFVQRCLSRFFSCDWGDLCAEDLKVVEEDYKDSRPLIASYRYFVGDRFQDEVWVSRDRSYEDSKDWTVTVMFPADY